MEHVGLKDAYGAGGENLQPAADGNSVMDNGKVTSALQKMSWIVIRPEMKGDLRNGNTIL